MERLTKRFDGWVMREGCHGPCRTCNGVKCADIFPMIDRLAAYEDTGLEPEEVVQTKLALMGKVLAEIKEFEEVPVNRMIELAQAEKNGRLVVLPPNDPLTLEELREMDGEPVWIIPICGSGGFCTWMLVDAEYELCREAHGEMAVFENCGKTWLSYRYKPEEG